MKNKPTTQITTAMGLVWGMAGGLAATVVMDLVLMGAFLAVGLPALTCFTVIGDTVAHLLTIQGAPLAGLVLFGAAIHYLVGPLLGAIFGAATAKLKVMRISSVKKGILFAVLFAELVSQPMLAITPILLNYSATDTLRWFGGSFVMHLVWGAVLGAVVSRAIAPRCLSAQLIYGERALG